MAPQTPLHKAKRRLAQAQTHYEQAEAKYAADLDRRAAEIETLRLEVVRLSREESERMDAAARAFLAGKR